MPTEYEYDEECDYIDSILEEELIGIPGKTKEEKIKGRENAKKDL